MSAEKFVQAARGLLGTRWRHRGRKPWAVDCIGLLVLSARAAGLQLQDETKYGREPWEDRLREAMHDHFGEDVEDWQIGDIALIQWSRGHPSHVGIIADYAHGGLSIIHAHNIHGVIETSLSGHVLDCVTDVYRPGWEG